jgi:large subunit ribosomal protein L28
MAYECTICGKKTVFGRSYRRKGKAKYLGGVGRHVTGVSNRQFRPNLQSIRIVGPEGKTVRAKVCTRCIKANKITKPATFAKVAKVVTVASA